MNICPAVYEDCRSIWRITQEPSVRAASTRSDAFSYASHCAWWDRRFADIAQRFYVAERETRIVGYVRYGRVARKADAEVALAVLPEHRRAGVALAMLSGTEALACAALGVTRLVALVLVDNVASQRLFARAGYRFDGWEERMGKQHQRWIREE